MGNEPEHGGVHIKPTGETYRIGDHHAAETFLAVAGTMAAAPFLQALATHFGTKLAGTIDETTRAAVRRFLRRQSDEPWRTSERPRPISLRTERGWMLTLDSDLPAEALGQLLVVEAATPPDLADEPPPHLSWAQTAWRLVGVKDGTIAELAWDHEANHWI